MINRLFFSLCFVCTFTALQVVAAPTKKSTSKTARVTKKKSIKPKPIRSAKKSKAKAIVKKSKHVTSKKSAAKAKNDSSIGKTNKNGIKHVAAHKFWSVHTYQEDGRKVCFIASKPQSSKGNYSSRGEVFFMITHRKDSTSTVENELSFAAGYPLQADLSVTVEIDAVPFKMPVVRDENAWTKDSEADQEVVTAMKKGNKMVIKGVSKKGTATTDSFSLSGVTAALVRAKKECGF